MIYCRTHDVYLWRDAITRHLEDEANTGCELVEVPGTDDAAVKTGPA